MHIGIDTDKISENDLDTNALKSSILFSAAIDDILGNITVVKADITPNKIANSLLAVE